ncbi:MAG: hypothetical protein IT373_05800 [Polyangiaceae bacterium]|nr:hypothetical protein [Polyangiaceae bacterium]
MMSCRTCCGLATDAREGALPFWRRLRYRAHLAICGRCRAFHRGYDQVVATLGTLPPEPPPEALQAALAARLRRRPPAAGG